MQPKLYTIAPERPFLATLADTLLGMAGDDPLLLSRVTVLLPTRRAVRDAFPACHSRTGREPGTLIMRPRMRPIGEANPILPAARRACG